MQRKLIATLFLIIFAAALIVSCSSAAAQTPIEAETATVVETTTVEVTEMDESSETDEIERPAGWSEDSHDKSADPDYDVVFPDDEVNRLDITISAENWEAMMADMTELYGEQSTSTAGAGPGGGRPAGGPPPGGAGPIDGDRPTGGPPDGAGPLEEALAAGLAAPALRLRPIIRSGWNRPSNSRTTPGRTSVSVSKAIPAYAIHGAAAT